MSDASAGKNKMLKVSGQKNPEKVKQKQEKNLN
jgi:hypothetical protein